MIFHDLPIPSLESAFCTLTAEACQVKSKGITAHSDMPWPWDKLRMRWDVQTKQEAIVNAIVNPSKLMSISFTRNPAPLGSIEFAQSLRSVAETTKRPDCNPKSSIKYPSSQVITDFKLS